MFRLRTLGGLSLDGPDGPLAGPVAQRKRLALLALLTSAPDRQVGRDKLVALLWPEVEADAARSALTDAVYALRKALGKDALRTIGEELRLEATVVRSDWGDFRAALARGDATSAVGLYHGPFLDGFFLPEASEFEHWVEAERSELARRYAEALEQLAESEALNGNLAAAAGRWHRLAAHDPYNGRIALRLMQALEATGDRAGAIRHATLHGALLREELGVEPDRAVSALAQQLQAGTGRQLDVAPGGSAGAPATTPRSGLGTRLDAHPSGPGDGRSVIDDVRSATAGPESPGAPRARRPLRRRRFGSLTLAGVLVLGVWVSWQAARPPGDSAAIGIRSLAILPLENLSPDSAQEFFADGMTDAITTELARLGEPRVISRTSTMRYKHSGKPLAEIARELGADALIEGTVLRDGDRVRITAQLIAARTDAHLWAESYERDVRDVLALQGDVARAIATAVRHQGRGAPAAPARPRPSVDPSAYAFYLKARHLWDENDVVNANEAIDYFQRTLAIEPDFAPAYAGLAEVYVHQDEWKQVPPSHRAARALALENIGRALQLDETLAETHTSLGHLLMHEEQWAAAEREYRRAIELNPGYAYARILYAFQLVALRRFHEAVAQAHLALELDPLTERTNSFAAQVLYFARRYDEAIAQCQRLIALYPARGGAYLGAARAHLAKGAHGEAIRMAEEGTRIWPYPNARVGLAHAYAASGQRERGQRLLESVLAGDSAGVDRLHVAMALSQLRQRDRALAWIEQAVRHDHGHVMFLQVEPAWDSLRSDPRFAALLRRMRLE